MTAKRQSLGARLAHLLTPRQREILTLMADHKDTDDGELVYEAGTAYVGLECTNGKLVLGLLRLCAIHLDEGEPGGFERYSINETGLQMLGRT